MIRYTHTHTRLGISDDVMVCVSDSSGPVLNAVMTSFKPEYIAQKAMLFSDMVRDCEETGLPKVRKPHPLMNNS